MTVDKNSVTKEVKVPTIYEIPDETIDFEKGSYHGLCVLMHFKKEGDINRKEYQADIEADKDEEDM